MALQLGATTTIGDCQLVGISVNRNCYGESMHQDRLMKSIEDIWKCIDVRTDDECWPWLRATNNTGYGTIWFEGKRCIAHRVAFVAAGGGTSIPAPRNRRESGFLLHSCDNRKCCNPKHLSVGTYNDNIQDMKSKGRSAAPRGDDHPKAKLTGQQAVEARSLLASGKTRKQVREHFGVSERIIDRIARGQSYMNAV